MKAFFHFIAGAATAFLACDGLWRTRLTYFWIDYFSFSIPVPGDRYNPTLGTAELILAAGLFVLVIVLHFRHSQSSIGHSRLSPSRRFPTPPTPL